MYFATIASTALLFSTIFAGPIAKRDNDNDETQKRICPHLLVADKGCIRYIKVSMSPVLSQNVDLTFPLIQNESDCI